MRGIEQPGVVAAELIHPTERFTKLANTLLHIHNEADGAELHCSWLSDDCTRRYELSAISEKEEDGSTMYSLDVYDGFDDTTIIASYLQGSVTGGLIKLLDDDGNILHDTTSSIRAAKEALLILSTKCPLEARQDLSYHVEQEFAQLIGAYIISDRVIEKRLDRAARMHSISNRQRFTEAATTEALRRFMNSIHQLTANYNTPLARLLGARDYAQLYLPVTEEAIDRLAVSSVRLYRHRRQ